MDVQKKVRERKRYLVRERERERETNRQSEREMQVLLMGEEEKGNKLDVQKKTRKERESERVAGFAF